MAKEKVPNLDKIRQAIERYESFSNGLDNLNGAYAVAENIELDEDDPDKVTADVTLVKEDSKETYSDCDYSLKKLGVNK